LELKWCESIDRREKNILLWAAEIIAKRAKARNDNLIEIFSPLQNTSEKR